MSYNNNNNNQQQINDCSSSSTNTIGQASRQSPQVDCGKSCYLSAKSLKQLKQQQQHYSNSNNSSQQSTVNSSRIKSKANNLWNTWSASLSKRSARVRLNHSLDSSNLVVDPVNDDDDEHDTLDSCGVQLCTDEFDFDSTPAERRLTTNHLDANDSTSHYANVNVNGNGNVSVDADAHDNHNHNHNHRESNNQTPISHRPLVTMRHGPLFRDEAVNPSLISQANAMNARCLVGAGHQSRRQMCQREKNVSLLTITKSRSHDEQQQAPTQQLQAQTKKKSRRSLSASLSSMMSASLSSSLSSLSIGIGGGGGGSSSSSSSSATAATATATNASSAGPKWHTMLRRRVAATPQTTTARRPRHDLSPSSDELDCNHSPLTTTVSHSLSTPMNGGTKNKDKENYLTKKKLKTAFNKNNSGNNINSRSRSSQLSAVSSRLLLRANLSPQSFNVLSQCNKMLSKSASTLNTSTINNINNTTTDDNDNLNHNHNTSNNAIPNSKCQRLMCNKSNAQHMEQHEQQNSSGMKPFGNKSMQMLASGAMKPLRKPLFGESLVKLCQIPHRKCTDPSELRLPAPIWRLLHELFMRAPDCVGIFRKSPNAKHCKELRLQLDNWTAQDGDCGSFIAKYHVTVVASVFKVSFVLFSFCFVRIHRWRH
ncbi:hypothetical protein GZH46_01136, partial [Fragariocoptes setiger]